MRLLTIAAVAALAAGIYHFRQAHLRRGAATEPTISDALIGERVRSAVASAAARSVDVRVADGIVTLRGSVKKAERDLALAAALAVPGVSRVANQLEVEDEPAGMEPASMRSGMTQPPE